MTKAVRHRLSGVNAESHKGTCSVCGLVTVFSAGRYWQCSVAKKKQNKAWKQRNPEKVAGQRRRSWARAVANGGPVHWLMEKDPVTLTGECSTCGTVDLRRRGRGMICETRWAELRVESGASVCSFCSDPEAVQYHGWADGRWMCRPCAEAWGQMLVATFRGDKESFEVWSGLAETQEELDNFLYWGEADPELGIPYRRRPSRVTSGEYE